MYDKRYNTKQIQRIRNRAAFGMFLCMAFLVFAVGKVAYSIGYDNGYNANTKPGVVKQEAKQLTAIPLQ